ncbi:MAG: PEGA domain-containing protein [Planctomycetia bacterium]|nr:PEGA domain-containing protein [Planctomycetia bacterium]
MTIRTNPPGALVYVDNYEIGRTPVSTDFIYYGTRRIRLEADGYQTYTAEQNFWPPWYEFPGLDFVTENLWPWEIRDERVVDFTLTPQIIVPTDALLARANELRSGGKSAGVPAVAQPGLPPMTTPIVPSAPPANFPAPPQPAPMPGRQYETLPPGGQALPAPPPKTGWMQRFLWWK